MFLYFSVLELVNYVKTIDKKFNEVTYEKKIFNIYSFTGSPDPDHC